MSNTKGRHLAALAGQIQTLNGNLMESEELLGKMSEQLLVMREFAAIHASMFMAQSRLLDVELLEANKAQEAKGLTRVDSNTSEGQ